MFELPLIFLGGLLGSAHCVGMCGGFAIMIGTNARLWRNNLLRQLVYSAGRMFTYAALGAAVGYAGLRLADEMPRAVNAQALLAIIAGVCLITQGLISARILSPAQLARVVPLLRRDRTAVIPCSGGMLGPLLRTPGSQAAFLAGMLTGFLPCGLLYAYLALATSTHSPLAGLIVMVAFGLGTVPLMVATGTSMSLVSPSAQFALRLAAWCVVATGVIALARGVYALQPSGSEAGCPLCRIHDTGA